MSGKHQRLDTHQTADINKAQITCTNQELVFASFFLDRSIPLFYYYYHFPSILYFSLPKLSNQEQNKTKKYEFLERHLSARPFERRRSFITAAQLIDPSGRSDTIFEILIILGWVIPYTNVFLVDIITMIHNGSTLDLPECRFTQNLCQERLSDYTPTHPNSLPLSFEYKEQS